MLHPSYTELMEKINKEGETGEEPVINSRYSIVIATSKRAREIIGGDEPLVNGMEGEKPLSIAVKELYDSKIKILPGDEENMEDEEHLSNEEFEELEHGKVVHPKPSKKAFVHVKWLNANPNLQIIESEKQRFYHSFGDKNLTSACFKKITYKLSN